MSLVCFSALPQYFALTRTCQTPEVVHDERLAIAEDFNAFFWESLIRAQRRICQVADAAVLIGNRGKEIIVSLVRKVSGMDRHGMNLIGGRAGEESKYVVHVTGFAKIPPAAFPRMHPMIGRKVPGVDPIVDHQWSAPVRKNLVHCLEGRGKAPVEAQHQQWHGVSVI